MVRKTKGKKISSPIMSLREVAEYLRINAATIYKLVKENDIPATKIRGQWRFKKDLLDKWLTDKMSRLKKQV